VGLLPGEELPGRAPPRVQALPQQGAGALGSLALRAEDGAPLQAPGRQGAGFLMRAHYLTGGREWVPAGKEQSAVTSKKKQGVEGGALQAVEGAAAGGARAAPVTQAVAGGDAPTDLYSLRQLAGLLGVDRNRLAEQVRDLESFQGPHGSRLYSLSAVEGVLAEDPDPDIREARLRKLEAEAGLAELKLQRERGEVVSHRDVLEDLTALIRSLHTRFAVTMPQQLAPRLRAKTVRQVEEILRTEMEQQFAELRREHESYLSERDAAEGVDAE
jgi:transcriptional regulator with XRE-family HTH domain